jgi:hypothetical protein
MAGPAFGTMVIETVDCANIDAQFAQLTVDFRSPHSGFSILILRIRSRIIYDSMILLRSDGQILTNGNFCGYWQRKNTIG